MNLHATATLLLATLLLLPETGRAQGTDQIGTVIVTQGTVLARDPAGATRTLARRNQLLSQDTLFVCADSFVNVRMIDNGQISLKSNTEFTFDIYQFDGDPATPDQAVMTLHRGGFRTVSGSVGTVAQDEYRIDTPPGSISIRGTFHAAVLDGPVLYTGTWEGGTTVSNVLGRLDIGLGSNYNYSRTAEGQAPEGLLTEPVVLGESNFTPGTGIINSPSPERTVAVQATPCA